jgi:hypothetical protein
LRGQKPSLSQCFRWWRGIEVTDMSYYLSTLGFVTVATTAAIAYVTGYVIVAMQIFDPNGVLFWAVFIVMSLPLVALCPRFADWWIRKFG